MEANGQKPSNPGARLANLLSKREKLQDELRNIEKQVFELETTYLQDSNQFGHVLKGFEGFLGSSKSASKYKCSFVLMLTFCFQFVLISVMILLLLMFSLYVLRANHHSLLFRVICHI
ncbi:hypothetical protein BVRB_3g049070 [Beta vulgaris subsp. vulgaris]|nr:hypothetical protein BVRB_3g049070 [Beta vulgaris subsp. vulgaris]